MPTRKPSDKTVQAALDSMWRDVVPECVSADNESRQASARAVLAWEAVRMESKKLMRPITRYILARIEKEAPRTSVNFEEIQFIDHNQRPPIVSPNIVVRLTPRGKRHLTVLLQLYEPKRVADVESRVTDAIRAVKAAATRPLGSRLKDISRKET